MRISLCAARTIRFLIIATLLVIAADRLPAPISEVPTPTPLPKHSSRPKPKQTAKPTITGETSERAVTPRSLPAPTRNTFEGTWIGTIDRGIAGVIDQTLIVNATGTVVVDKSSLGSFTRQAAWDGTTIRWRGCAIGSSCNWTLTPNGDGKTAAVTETSPLLNSSSIFHKTSR